MLHLGGKITNQLISTETPNFQSLSLSLPQFEPADQKLEATTPLL